MRVDEPVLSLWESRTACGRPICPHTPSTVGSLPVHNVGPVVHSYPQTRAQRTAPSAVHRLCTTHRFHSPPGKNARYPADCDEALGAVVDRGSPDHADVTTHRCPVDDCGQLDPHAVYEAVPSGLPAASGRSRGMYPQVDALRWASLWMGVDEAVDVGSPRVGGTGRRRHGCSGTWAPEAAAAGTCDGLARAGVRHGPSRGARRGRRVGTARRVDRVDTRRRRRVTGNVPACWKRAAARAGGVEKAAERRTGPPGVAGGLREPAHSDAPQPRCCCLILLVSSVTWL